MSKQSQRREKKNKPKQKMQRYFFHKEGISQDKCLFLGISLIFPIPHHQVICFWHFDSIYNGTSPSFVDLPIKQH